MKTATKFRCLSFIQAWWPIWALEKKARLTRKVFSKDIAKARSAKDFQEVQVLEQNCYSEANEYLDEITAIQSTRLSIDAKKLFIFLPDLKWETGDFGCRFLDRASLSRLHHAVQEEKAKIRDYRVKLAAAVTGAIGALIGLVAMLKK